MNTLQSDRVTLEWKNNICYDHYSNTLATTLTIAQHCTVVCYERNWVLSNKGVLDVNIKHVWESIQHNDVRDFFDKYLVSYQ